MEKVENWCGSQAFDFQSEINLITLEYVLVLSSISSKSSSKSNSSSNTAVVVYNINTYILYH